MAKNSPNPKGTARVPRPTSGAIANQTVLIHLHIFKNGGSTLDAALKRNLGAGWTQLEGDDPDHHMDWQAALQHLKSHREVRIVSSHTLRYPPPAQNGFNLLPLLLIRHPLDRIASIYYYERSKTEATATRTNRAAQTETLAEFVRNILDLHPEAGCDAQTSFIARAGDYYHPPEASDLEAAKVAIKSLVVPGVVEKMDLYLAMLETALAGILPPLDLAAPDENRNPQRSSSLLARLRAIRDQLPSPLWRELRQRNRLDLELWRFTYRLALTQYAQMSKAEKHLESFRSRKAQVQLPGISKVNAANGNELPWTGERLVPSATGDFVAEHLHRYALAMEFAADREVLDVASGEGYGSAFLARVARRVIGVDSDPVSVTHASVKYGRNNLKFVAGRAEQLPLPDASVDLVVSFETLEHLDDHEAMLREIRRVLRPGGLVVISTPDSAPYQVQSGKLNPFHVHELDLAGFTKLLAGHFAQTAIARQKSVSGSWIFPVEATAAESEYSGDFSQIQKALPGENAPYLIALASDSPLPAFPASFFNSSQLMLLQVQALQAEQASERAAFAVLQKEFEERTSWAHSLEQELRGSLSNFEKLSAEFAARSAWTLSLEQELQAVKDDFARLTKEHAERTAWAFSVEKEIQAAKENFARLTREHEARTAWATSLQTDLHTAQKVYAERDQQLQGVLAQRNQFREICHALAALLPVEPDPDEIVLLERCLGSVAELRRDLVAREAAIGGTTGAALDAQLRAEMSELEINRLVALLADAQIHLDHLLRQARHFQDEAIRLGLGKQETETLLRQREQDLGATIAERQSLREELGRYESTLLARLATRLLSPKSPREKT